MHACCQPRNCCVDWPTPSTPIPGRSQPMLSGLSLQGDSACCVVLLTTHRKPFQTVADCVPMLQVLQKLADMQTVDYGFEVYQLPMHCDAPVTVLSCGSSLLRGSTAVQIPLQPTAEFGEHQHSQHKCGGNCEHDMARCGCRHSAAVGAACGLPGSDSCKSFSGPGKETQVLAPRRSE